MTKYLKHLRFVHFSLILVSITVPALVYYSTWKLEQAAVEARLIMRIVERNNREWLPKYLEMLDPIREMIDQSEDIQARLLSLHWRDTVFDAELPQYLFCCVDWPTKDSLFTMYTWQRNLRHPDYSEDSRRFALTVPDSLRNFRAFWDSAGKKSSLTLASLEVDVDSFWVYMPYQNEYSRGTGRAVVTTGPVSLPRTGFVPLWFEPEIVRYTDDLGLIVKYPPDEEGAVWAIRGYLNSIYSPLSSKPFDTTYLTFGPILWTLPEYILHEMLPMDDYDQEYHTTQSRIVLIPLVYRRYPFNIRQALITNSDLSIPNLDFQTVFPNLAELYNQLPDLELAKLIKTIDALKSLSPKEIRAINITIPGRSLALWGVVAVPLVQFYFLLHLIATLRKGNEQPFSDFPWIGMYSFMAARIGTLMSSVALPLLTCIALTVWKIRYSPDAYLGISIVACLSCAAIGLSLTKNLFQFWKLSNN